jgi:hypothetical protein
LPHFRRCGRRAAAAWAAAAVSVLCADFARAGAADREARVDAEGVLRWTDDGGEVALLGVNYYTPFTVDYAETKRLGLDQRQVIHNDVAHFRRLGLGCVRVHCFDREFSDAEGNLVDNHHLELLDFLVSVCASNGIYSVMTPIAWWGGSFAPGNIHGFSDVYPMHRMTADRATWPVQARFLRQFAEHVNRFTGRRYADDPAVLALECINEPLYPKDTPDGLITDYIDALTDGLRASGTAKPVYYNSWQGRNAAAGASRADGVTCSYYPTGLVAGRELEGPQLGRVRASSLRPDASIARKSRMVYEFDAADVGGSYMYPALAKLFRFEGAQVAAQFQYDPLPLADVNRNWQTHHLNLVYTPGKALSLAIAAEVFARVPRGTPYEAAENEIRFPPFRVSVAEDLAEMAAPDAFIYSNTTRTQPPDPAALERVWGRGSSPVVEYGGTGAYFLDRAAPGVWRLQVYPDVFTAADPFTGAENVKVKILPPRHRAMTIRLPDLTTTLDVRPGDHVLIQSETPNRSCTVIRDTSGRGINTVSQNGGILSIRPGPRYVVPADETNAAPLVRAAVAPQWRTGAPLELSAEAALATNLTARFMSEAGQTVEVPMQAAAWGHSPYRFEGVFAGQSLTPGVWGVTFRAAGRGGVADWPDARTFGTDWLPAAGKTTPLFDPKEKPSIHGDATVGQVGDLSCIRLSVADIGTGSHAAGWYHGLPARVLGEHGLQARDTSWGLRIRSRGNARVEIGLRMKNGQGLGVNLTASSAGSETVVSAADLIKLWGLKDRADFRWEDVKEISVLTGAWLYRQGKPEVPVTFDLLALERVPLMPALRLEVIGDGGMWSLFDVKAWLRVPLWSVPLRRWGLSGDGGRQAVHLGADRFDGEHQSLSLRVPCDGKTFARLWQTDGENAILMVRARAAQPKTTAFELAFIEKDGVAWGTNVPLTPEWTTRRIPLTDLRLFTQWDKGMTAKAGPHLRLSRLETVNVCFGKWLYPQAAAEPHAFEISEIGIECQTP